MNGSRFVGREAERAELVAALTKGSLLSVVGTGGVGKSRLVAEVASELANRVDADLLVGPLADLPLDADADAVAGALGFESASAASVAFAEAGPLVVLDNCEHVLHGVRELVDRVRAVSGSVTIIATSREPLDVAGERVMMLKPLALPGVAGVDADASPAVELFLDRADAAGATILAGGPTLATVAELCRRLDGIPLAIELAAARTRAMSPSDLLGLMDQRLDVLRRASGDGSRHQSVRAAIEVSLGTLSAEERAFFRRLGGFDGPFDITLAHAVAGEDGSDRIRSMELLSRLVERNLVVADTTRPTTRYRLLELLRAAAEEALESADELTVVQARFVDAMTTAAERIITAGLERWSSEVLSVASSQFANLVAANDWCCAHDASPDRAFVLIVPMFAAVHEGKPAEVLHAARKTTTRWPATPGPWRAEALAVAATAAALAGRPDDVASIASSIAADPARSLVADALVARAEGLIARADDDRRAYVHFERARSAAAEAGFTALESEMQILVAAQLDLMGETSEAVEVLRGVVLRSGDDADLFTEALARLILSRSLLRRGDIDKAGHQLDAAEAAAYASGTPWWTAALSRTRAALVAMSAEGWAGAAPIVRRAVDAAARQGALGELALTLRGAAVLAQRAGERELAVALATAAPMSTAISVVPELFPGESVEIETSGAAPPTSDVVESLRRARTALDRSIGATRTAASRPYAESTPASAPDEHVLRREGNAWTVRFDGTTIHLSHLKGLGDLAVLLSRPRAEVHCLELMGAADTSTDHGPLIDGRAKREYQARILDLQAEIDEARDHHDDARAERAERELDALVEQLSGAFGLHGAPRRTGSSAEKARTAVTFRLRAAMRKVGEHHPALGRHLGNSVRTGTWCSYQPERDLVWEVAVNPGADDLTS